MPHFTYPQFTSCCNLHVIQCIHRLLHYISLLFLEALCYTDFDNCCTKPFSHFLLVFPHYITCQTAAC